MIDLSKRLNPSKINEFVDLVLSIQKKIPFKVSSRGWGYLLEQHNLITKDQFDKVETLINKCRKNGLLPVDFVAEEADREFKEVHRPNTDSYIWWYNDHFDTFERAHLWYTPDWWEGEEYYIQMIVEKSDLVTLFRDLCHDYHIPIANSSGWSSILQRAEYTRRFREAEKRGLKCVLLYCGDHDPDGLRISDTLRKNIQDVSEVTWKDGFKGYDPSNLTIDRFGLNYDFIIENGLTWIDNLVTGSGNVLARVVNGEIVPGLKTKGKNAGQPHQNFNMPYMQEYLRKVGVRKCEANALVVAPEEGRRLCEQAIQKYLGVGAYDRFQAKKKAQEDELLNFQKSIGIDEPIRQIREALDNFDSDE